VVRHDLLDFRRNVGLGELGDGVFVIENSLEGFLVNHATEKNRDLRLLGLEKLGDRGVKLTVVTREVRVSKNENLGAVRQTEAVDTSLFGAGLDQGANCHLEGITAIT